jgi:micrococcal nuclease
VGKAAQLTRTLFLALSLATVTSLLVFQPAEALAGTIQGTVVTVFDGDTVEVATDDDRVEKVRYLLIDTPELHHPKRGVEEFGLAAALANRALVLGKRVRLETDVQLRDRYGRLLATVWLDLPQGSVMVNERLVEEGFALPFTMPPNVRYADRIHAALLKARSEGRGFWNAAAGRLFTPRQVWADLPLLAGVFVTVDMRVDEIARSKTRWTLSEKGARTSLVIYDDRPGLFGPVQELKGKRLRVIGKIQPSFRGAEILLVDPAQVLSVTAP